MQKRRGLKHGSLQMVKIICFEGANAVGKSHAIQQVSEWFDRQGISHRIYKAPDYSGVGGCAITDFLAGKTLSGDLIYSDDVPRNRCNTAVLDFKDIDYTFRVNRDAVYKRILSDLEQTPVDFVLLDRWTMSAVVYSKLRFADIEMQQQPEYYQALINDEMKPDLTLVLEESPTEIERRMQVRIDNANQSTRINARGQQIPGESRIPLVWRQSSKCFARIMNEFRDLATSSNTNSIKIITPSDNYLRYIQDLI